MAAGSNGSSGHQSVFLPRLQAKKNVKGLRGRDDALKFPGMVKTMNGLVDETVFSVVQEEI